MAGELKALTLWQPWASLVVLGAKPHEFRNYSFCEGPWPFERLVGQRIVIHAGARPVRVHEVDDVLWRIATGSSALDERVALPLLRGVRDALIAEAEGLKAHRAAMRAFRRAERRPPMAGDPPRVEPPLPPSGQILPLKCGLGTAVIGRPVRVTELFAGTANDSDRLDHSKWAWPLTDVRCWSPPVPASGEQGFWTWREALPLGEAA